jgi:hypothetical protein
MRALQGEEGIVPIRRTLKIRLAQGESAGVTAIVRVRCGACQVAELTLRSGAPSASVEIDVEAAAPDARSQSAGGTYCFEVEYQWGYAREAWYKGSADADELILPYPGSTGAASFAFPRR